jgi:hypothetical protein
MNLHDVEKAVAEAMAKDKSETERFYAFVSAYEGRLSSLTGIAPDTIACDDDPEASDEYWEAMWLEFLNGVDPVALADEDAKRYFVP